MPWTLAFAFATLALTNQGGIFSNHEEEQPYRSDLKNSILSKTLRTVYKWNLSDHLRFPNKVSVAIDGVCRGNNREYSLWLNPEFPFIVLCHVCGSICRTKTNES